jgi:hypothetical protein
MWLPREREKTWHVAAPVHYACIMQYVLSELPEGLRLVTKPRCVTAIFFVSFFRFVSRCNLVANCGEARDTLEQLNIQ